jgi:hypothetical protein
MADAPLSSQARRTPAAALPEVALPALRLVEPGPAGSYDDDDAHVTVPVRRADGDVVRVPAVLLLSAAGRCVCDDCCRDYASRRARARMSVIG